jgi:hypothetical protein
MVLIYIEAYGISICSPETLFEAAVFGNKIPNIKTRRGIDRTIGEMRVPDGMKGRGGIILINDRILTIPTKMREIKVMNPKILR